VTAIYEIFLYHLTWCGKILWFYRMSGKGTWKSLNIFAITGHTASWMTMNEVCLLWTEINQTLVHVLVLGPAVDLTRIVAVGAATLPRSRLTQVSSVYCISRDQPNSREKMHDFTAEFLKCVKFHGKFTERVSEIHGPHRRYFEVLHYCKRRNFWTTNIYYTKSKLKTVNVNYLVLKCDT